MSTIVEQKSKEILTASPIPDIPIYDDWGEVPPMNRWVNRISAWIPLYLHGHGDYCLIVDESGPMFYIALSSADVFRHVALHYGFSFGMLHDLSIQLLQKKLAPPIPMPGVGDALASVKTRVPKSPNDGAMAYVAISQVEAVEKAGKKQCRITLKCGFQIHVLMEKKKCMTQLCNADWFRSKLVELDRIPAPKTIRGVWDPRYL